MIPQGEAILSKLQEQENIIPAQVELIVRSISLQADNAVLQALDRFLIIEQIPLETISLRTNSKPHVSFEESLL